MGKKPKRHTGRSGEGQTFGGWATAGHQKAARHVVSEDLGASLRSVARNFALERKWLDRLVNTTAALWLGRFHAAFDAFLRGCQPHRSGLSAPPGDQSPSPLASPPDARSVASPPSRTGSAESPPVIPVDPVAFVLQRAYDETGRVCRTLSTTEEGEAEYVPETAKLMSGALSFAAVLRVHGLGYHVIVGKMPTTLGCMASQHAPVVAQCLREHFNLEPRSHACVLSTFKHVAIVRCTDMHRSYPAAERALRSAAARGGMAGGYGTSSDPDAQGSAVDAKPHLDVGTSHVADVADGKPLFGGGLSQAEPRTCHFRCSLHRVATGEKSALSLDSELERTVLWITLALRETNTLRSVRRRLRHWLSDRKTWVMLRGLPPDEVRRWRGSVRPLLFPAGEPSTQAEVRRQLCWDHVANGDGRNFGKLEHYCNGSNCCPNGFSDLRRKVLGPYGILGLLKPPAKVWPRKSWAGQAEVVGQLLQLELCAGALSQSVKLPLAAQVAQPGHGPSLPGREAPTRATLDCLGHPAFASRLLAFACVLGPLRVLKSDIMGRSGEQWELEQQALSTSPGRSRRFPIEVAGDLEEVKIAQGDLKRLLGEGLKAPPLVGLCPRSTDESRAVEGFRFWRMCARAGAALQRYMAEELSRYPWRGLSALLGGREDVFVADANSCPSQCFMDEVCRAHWEQHPSLQDLRSPESQAKLLAIALQAQDNIGSIERQHAGARRGAAVHEQTWSDTTLFSSARHVLKHARADAGGGSLGAVPAAEATGLPTGPRGSEAGGRDSQAQPQRKRRSTEAPQPQRKRRRVDRFNAWTAVNVVGRLVDKADRQRYREAIRRPEIFAHYEQLAQDMTRARDAGAKRPPRRTEGKSELRKHRTRFQRRKLLSRLPLTWSVPEVREAIRREKACLLVQEAKSRFAHLRARRARSAAVRRGHQEAASRYAEGQRQVLQDKLPEWLFRSTIPVRGSLVSSQGAMSDVQVHQWRPPDTAASAILEQLPHCMSQESGRMLTEWECRHVLCGGDRISVPRETNKEKSHRVALEMGRCTCSPGGQILMRMAQKFSRVVLQHHGSGVKDSKLPETTLRRKRALQNCTCVVELSCGQERWWLLLAWHSFEVGSLPTALCLRCVASGSSPGSSVPMEGSDADASPLEVSLHPRGSPGHGWVSCLFFLEECDSEQICTVRFWTLLSDDQPNRSVRASLAGEDAKMPPLIWWRGRDDISAAHRPREPNELASSGSDSDSEPPPPPPPAAASAAALAPEVQGAVAPPGEGSPGDSGLLGKIKATRKERLRSGIDFSCKAMRAAGREALEFRLVYKEGGVGKKPSYQVTCRHHVPEAFVNRNGRPYSLPCRRTAMVTDGDEEATLQRLLKWVRAGPLADDRHDHQAMTARAIDDNASSDPESPNEEDVECLSDSPGEGSPRGGALVPGEGSPGEQASRGLPAGLPELECWVCGARHSDGKCPLAKRLFPGPEPVLKSAAAFRPAGRLAQDALRLPEKAVQCKDVPGDGNCLFHAVGREMRSMFQGSPLLPPNPDEGQSWREWLTAYALHATDILDGSSIHEWVLLTTGMTPEAYAADMGTVRGPETWGGFLEVALWCEAWANAGGGLVSIMMFQQLSDGQWESLSVVGGRRAPRPEVTQICIAWTGAHWVRARVRAPYLDVVHEWRLR